METRKAGLAGLPEPPRAAMRTDFKESLKISFKIGGNLFGKQQGGPALLFWGESEPVGKIYVEVSLGAM